MQPTGTQQFHEVTHPDIIVRTTPGCDDAAIGHGMAGLMHPDIAGFSHVSLKNDIGADPLAPDA